MMKLSKKQRRKEALARKEAKEAQKSPEERLVDLVTKPPSSYGFRLWEDSFKDDPEYEVWKRKFLTE